MKSLKLKALGFCMIFLLFLLAFANQESSDISQITGSWEVEVNAEGEYYYLSLTIEESEGKLSGRISESSGLFDVEIANILYDGKSLNFEFISPTPPDSIERNVKAIFSVGTDRMEGTLTVEELGASALAVAERKKK